jgi:hypothetical protein
MALAVAKCRITSTRGSDLRQLTVQFNNVLDTLRLITVKMDADAGITDTNYTTVLETGVGGALSKIGNLAGTSVAS